jgi:hypothetical protein
VAQRATRRADENRIENWTASKSLILIDSVLALKSADMVLLAQGEQNVWFHIFCIDGVRQQRRGS